MKTDYDIAIGRKPRIPCPICGRLRGKNDLTHGKCYEETVRRETEKTLTKNDQKNAMSLDEKRIAAGKRNKLKLLERIKWTD